MGPARAGMAAHDQQAAEAAAAAEPWVLADYSVVNSASAASWEWLLGRRTALAALAVPLPTLHDLCESDVGDVDCGWGPTRSV